MSEIKNKKILITGGANGLGKAMGEIVLSRGATLIIWDKDEFALDATIAEFSNYGKIYGYHLDISNKDKCREIFNQTKEKHGNVDILINNAGVTVGKYFHEHTSDDISLLIEINVLAAMNIANLALSGMIEQNSGHICNISSCAGLIGSPKMSVYAASKWAILGWSESLKVEMKRLKKNVKITSVTPYYMNTEMFKNIKSRVPILDSKKLATDIICAIEKNRSTLGVPWSMRRIRFLQSILPAKFFEMFLDKFLGIYQASESFETR